MSLVACGIQFWPRYPSADYNTATGSITFDAAGDLLASMFQAPVTGTINKIHYYINSNSAFTGSIEISIQTVSATDGKVSGAVGTTVTKSATFTAGFYSETVDASVTAGTIYAILLKVSAYTSGSCTISTGQPVNNTTAFPYRSTSTGGTDTLAVARSPAHSIEYTGGLFYEMPGEMICHSGRTAVNVSTTNPTSRGNIFRIPYSVRAIGIWAITDADDEVMRLRDSTGTAITSARCSPDKDQRGASLGGWSLYMFDAAFTTTLAANTDYIVSHDGVSATTNYCMQITVPSNAHLDQLPGGAGCYGYTLSSGTWSAANTTRYAIGIIYDQIDTGGGGGMVVHPGNSGGMRG